MNHKKYQEPLQGPSYRVPTEGGVSGHTGVYGCRHEATKRQLVSVTWRSGSYADACRALTSGHHTADAQRVVRPEHHPALPALLSLSLLLLLLHGLVERPLLGNVDVKLRLVVRHHATV